MTFAPRLYNRYNHPPCARQHMWPSPGPSWPLVRLQVPQNSGSQMFMLRVKTLLATDEIQEEENYRERGKISALVSACIDEFITGI